MGSWGISCFRVISKCYKAAIASSKFPTPSQGGKCRGMSRAHGSLVSHGQLNSTLVICLHHRVSPGVKLRLKSNPPSFYTQIMLTQGLDSGSQDPTVVEHPSLSQAGTQHLALLLCIADVAPLDSCSRSPSKISHNSTC